MPATWSPTSWQSKAAQQQPVYPDQVALAHAARQLAKLPPLVSSFEIESLKSQLAAAARGERFLLQGGDCAESFEDCESSVIASKLKILLQMSLVLVHGLHKRVIRVGRLAGQYAKPRTSETETREGPEGPRTLPAYRGDLVNDSEFTLPGRTPDPARLLRGYERSALTINFIRALIDGGFADLHHPEYWNLQFVQRSPRAAEYQRIVESIGQSLRFMETLAGQPGDEATRVDFYTSHECLHLLYEQAQTRQVPRREGWYNLSTHFPWVGLRTSAPQSAHVEYARGIRNPIAVKVGPSTSGDELRELLDVLHPDDEPGRLTLIHRFGTHEIARRLPPLIRAVRATGKAVLWCCDPMHGNTELVRLHATEPALVDAPSVPPSLARDESAGPSRSGAAVLTAGHVTGTRRVSINQDAPRPVPAPHAPGAIVKTRKFEHILSELDQAFEIHRRMGTHLGGVHFELTGEDVTECTGGAGGTNEADLSRAYKSQGDPRLNYEQSLELAMHIARQQRAERP